MFYTQIKHGFFDQSEHAQGPIYIKCSIMVNNRQLLASVTSTDYPPTAQNARVWLPELFIILLTNKQQIAANIHVSLNSKGQWLTLSY